MKRRLLAFLLTVVIIIPLLPVEMVLANAQSNVYNVLIDVVPSTSKDYKIRLEWTNPSSWSTVSDSKAIQSDMDYPHTPEGYWVRYRNATAGESYQIAEDKTAGSGELPADTEITQNLTTGSIYQYRIIPYHRHSYPISGSAETTKAYAPEDNTIPPEDVLVMTDLEIEAKGSGSTLTVTWDNPQIDSKDVFTGYKIYYQEGGANVSNNLDAFNNSVIVNLQNTSVNVTRTKDQYRTGVQRLTYVINDPTLVPGSIYAVRVEPLYLSEEVRKNNRDSNSTIQINGKLYRIAFKTKENSPFRTNEASISIPLDVLEDGKEFLKLKWSGLSSTIGTVERIEVWQLADPDSSTSDRKIGTIYSSQAMFINTWQIDKPLAKSSYKLKIYISGKTEPVESEVASFDPSIVNITPNKPEITATHTVDALGNPTEIAVDGSAFIRYPYNKNEEALAQLDGTYIDDNTSYDLYISDAREYLDDLDIPKSVDMQPYSRVVNRLDRTKISFSLKSYYTKDEDGLFVEKPLEQNKIYYIKLYAIKPTTAKNYYSEPAYTLEYIPIYKDIGAPKILAKPPLKIREINGAEDITTNYIGIEWKTEWTEVLNEQDNNWDTNVAVANIDGKLSFLYGRDAVNASSPYVLVDFATADENVYSLFAEALVKIGYLDSSLTVIERVEETKKHIAARTVVFDDGIDYEVYVKEESVVNKESDYESYINEIVKSSNWIKLTKANGATTAGMQIDTSVPGTMYSRITRYLGASGAAGNLEPNKTYQIFLRPYRGDAYGQPSFIFGTTLPTDTTLVITPTVPILKEVEVTDTTASVKWADATSSISYVLAYSDVPLDDPSNAAYIVTMEELNADGIRFTEDGTSYLQYTIEGLFPEQSYYVWVIAYTIDEATGSVIFSDWSNPLYIQTQPAIAPKPPKGLGLASLASLLYYNKSNSTDVKPSADKYIVVEWLKDALDPSEGVTAAQGTGFDVLADPDITETCLVRFNDLLAKTPYYVRAKTTMTLTKSGDNPTVRSYSYTVQFSEDKTFLDAVEAVVLSGSVQTGDKTIVLESDWCEEKKLTTEASGEDFDSDKNPDLYPLPDKNYEITYDKSTGELIYRFRTNKEDADKNDDQLVDQRLMGELLRNNTYTYTIDLSSHEKFTNPSKRIVEIPYSIMQAFGERKISFELIAGNTAYNFSPNFLNNSEVRNAAVFGQSSIVSIAVTENPRDLPSLSAGQRFAANPQKLEITMTTPERIVPIKSTDANINVTIEIDNANSLANKNIGAYIYTDASGVWERMNYTYDTVARKYSANTVKTGLYAAIAGSISASSSNYANSSAAMNVASKIDIKDIGVLGLDSPVTSSQLNNLVAAVAGGRKEATINTPLNQTDYSSLTRTNMLLSGSTVSREQGVAVLIKLYEVRTKSQVRQYTQLGTTSYTDIQTADTAYQTALLKAAHIGFFSSKSQANPKGTLTLGDALYMLDIVMQDSGL